MTEHLSDAAINAKANNASVPVLTTTLELFQLRVLLPDYYKGPGLYPGDNMPRGTVYLCSDGTTRLMPKNAIFMGTETVRNLSANSYEISPDGIPTYISPNSTIELPAITFNVTSGMYTQNLVINDTLISRYAVTGLQSTECVDNQTNYTIIAINNGKTHYIKSNTDYHFTSGIVGLILPPGTENHAEDGTETVASINSTSYENADYIQVTHLSNSSEGVINDIQASNNTLTNTSPLIINVPMASTETNTIYNQSNAPVKIISNNLTYMLQVNQVQQFDADTKIELVPNIQTDESGNLSGTQAVNNYYQVVVQTVDSSLRPQHCIKPPELDSSSNRKDKPPSSQLLGVDTSAINPHVNPICRFFRDATNSIFFIVNGMAEGAEGMVENAPNTIKELPADVKDIPHFLWNTPKDVAALGESLYGIGKFTVNKTLVDPIKNDIAKFNATTVSTPNNN